MRLNLLCAIKVEIFFLYLAYTYTYTKILMTTFSYCYHTMENSLPLVVVDFFFNFIFNFALFSIMGICESDGKTCTINILFNVYNAFW